MSDVDDGFDGGTIEHTEGVLLAGRFKVLRELGRGAMGTVYLAEDLSLD
jgi:serine/threonine protein kinase